MSREMDRMEAGRGGCRFVPARPLAGYGLLALTLTLMIAIGAVAASDRREPPLRPDQKAREDFQRLLPRKAHGSDMVFVGKVFCSLEREVHMPFPGLITEVKVQAGQAVRRGEVLANLKPAKAKLLLEADTMDREEGPVSGILQEESALRSPMDGTVIWIHPDMRPGSVLDPEKEVFLVGLMDPMLLRAHVYEEEALRLEVGDKVTVIPESLPQRRLRANVSRIAWSPVSMELLAPSYYEVEFTVPNPHLHLRKGLRVIIHMFKPPGSRQSSETGKQKEPTGP